MNTLKAGPIGQIKRRMVFGDAAPDWLQDDYSGTRDRLQQTSYEDAVKSGTGIQLHLVECNEPFYSACLRAGIPPLAYAFVQVQFEAKA